MKIKQESGYLRAPSGIRQNWSFRIYLNGRPFERSLGTAERRAPEVRARLVLLSEQPASVSRFSAAMLKEVATIEHDVGERQAERVSDGLATFLKRVGSDVLLERFQARRFKEGMAWSTVDKELGFLVRMLRRNGFDVKRPKMPAKHKHRHKGCALTEDECARFFAACPAHLKCFFLTLLATGSRPAELRPSTRSSHVPLLKSEIDFSAGTILIRSAKVQAGGEESERLMPVEPALLDMLAGQAAQNPGAHVLPALATLHRHFDTILAEAGIEKTDPRGRKLTAHCFRHTYATRQAGAMANPLELHRVLGHSNMKQTLDYMHSTAGVPIVPISQYVGEGT